MSRAVLAERECTVGFVPLLQMSDYDSGSGPWQKKTHCKPPTGVALEFQWLRSRPLDSAAQGACPGRFWQRGNALWVSCPCFKCLTTTVGPGPGKKKRIVSHLQESPLSFSG